jgi:hypothetical protein
VVTSVGPRNAYKDMLDNVVSLIACVSMNHQNQLEQMTNGAMFATPPPISLMTRLPRSPGSTLVLRLCQQTVHDFISPLLPPCGPHLSPLVTMSLEQSLHVFSTPRGLTGNDLSCLFFTCTNTSQAATCTCKLSQGLVHTMLSITHHTRKQPSTGPRTT